MNLYDFSSHLLLLFLFLINVIYKKNDFTIKISLSF